MEETTNEAVKVVMLQSGMLWAYFGAAIAAFLGAIGSSVGVGIAGMAASGLISRDPDKFGKALLLQALPGTQGIYGFLGAFLVISKIGQLGAKLTPELGLWIFAACLPVAVSCLISGIYQGKVSAAGINIIAKAGDEHVGKGIIFAAMVETYAVLGLIATILLLNGITG